MKEILVLGPGCFKCNKVAELAEQAAKELGIEYEIIKFTHPNAIAGFGVTVTPGLIVDGKLMVSGRVPSLEEIKRMLSQPETPEPD